MTRRLACLLRRARRDDGSVTAEFVIVLPLFFMVFLGAIEAGILMTRSVMLERAVDMSVRDLRIGRYPNPTHEQIKNDICDRMVIMPSCRSDLMLELRPVSTATWGVFDGPVRCVDRTAQIQPVISWTNGEENEMMLVRACAVFDPIFPTSAWGLQLDLDASGGYQLVAMSAFVNEPS